MTKPSIRQLTCLGVSTILHHIDSACEEAVAGHIRAYSRYIICDEYDELENFMSGLEAIVTNHIRTELG